MDVTLFECMQNEQNLSRMFQNDAIELDNYNDVFAVQNDLRG